MAFAVMRMSKVKTIAHIAGLAHHLERERETPNADPKRTPLNERLAGSGDWVADVEARLAVAPTVRSNAVLAIEHVLTASPEYFGATIPEEADRRRDEWRDASMAWLHRTYGPANVVAAVMHRDESTPHIQALVVPIDERGRLNARHFVGGDRHRLTELQDSYHAAVAPLGIDRGVRGSVAQHQDIQRFYARMQEPARAQTRAVDLEQVMTALGGERGISSLYAWKLGGEAISVDGERWYNATRQVGGTGAVELVLHAQPGYDTRQSIAWLHHAVGRDAAVTAATRHAETIADRDPRPAYRAPDRDERQWDRVRHSLVEHRGLAAEGVDGLHAQGRVYADTRGNAVFLHKDEQGEVTGASLLGQDLKSSPVLAAGTRREDGRFRVTLPGRETGGNPRPTLILADSPLDALSVADLHGRLYEGRERGPVTVVALEGSRRLPESAINETLRQGGVVRIAVTNDQAAQRIGSQISAQHPHQVVRDRPALGDWNNTLRWSAVTTHDPQLADWYLSAMWRRDHPRNQPQASPPRDRNRSAYER